jgi:hypothetical protein
MEVSRRLRKFRLSWWFFVPWYSSKMSLKVLFKFLLGSLKTLMDVLPEAASGGNSKGIVSLNSAFENEWNADSESYTCYEK